MPEIDKILDITIEGVKLGAGILMSSFGRIHIAEADKKGTSDYVSSVDRRSEEAMREFLQRELPESVFLGEEMGQGGEIGNYRWIVDPLDGTTNFLQGFPAFGVSAALERYSPGRRWGEILIGVVMHPMTGEIWTAVKGQGAKKNNWPIRVSAKGDFSQALLATGFPFRAKSELKVYLKTFEQLFLRCAGIRRVGAASLDLCWTAEGIFDGFWEHRLSPWDIAAGALIIEEAGGKFTGFTGENDYLDSGNVLGANPHIHAAMLDIIRATTGTVPP